MGEVVARSADDPLPFRPARVLVAGSSGSGKTTVAAAIAERLRLPQVELDALHHGPAWTPLPSFDDDVRRLAAEPAWVTEWQYPSARPVLLAAADLMVWLDLPRRTVMRQVVPRTLHRRLHRVVLWNGNVEPPLWTIFTDQEHIIRWAWTTHAEMAARVVRGHRVRPDLPLVRLRSRHEVARWLAGPLQTVAREA